MFIPGSKPEIRHFNRSFLSLPDYYKYITIVLLFFPPFLFAQKIYISKYIYGNFTKDNNHRLEIFNESDRTRNVGGYMIVTRNYVARIPQKTMIQPFSALRFSKDKQAESDIIFLDVKDFLIRFPSSKSEGDYVVLYDTENRILSAVYFSPTGKASFLPDRGELITGKGETIPFEVPSGSDNIWDKLDISPDPAMACVYVGKKWQVTSKNKNLVPATEYSTPQALYVNGIVTLKWQTLFEEDCFRHSVERSKDGEKFSELATVNAAVGARKSTEYLYYDKELQKESRYFYRIRNADKFNNIIYSPVVEVMATESSGDFSFQIIEKNISDPGSFLIRFSSEKKQFVSLKILDERFYEIGTLFSDDITANSENLVKYNSALPVGKYFIIAETDSRRYYKEYVVKVQ